MNKSIYHWKKQQAEMNEQQNIIYCHMESVNLLSALLSYAGN
jgi:hypothetical protein